MPERRQPQRRLPVSVFFAELQNPCALDAFDKNLGVSVGEFERLNDVGDRSDLIDLGRLGIVDGGVVLRREENALVALERRFKRVYRGFPADDEGNHHVMGKSRRPGSEPWAGGSVRTFL